MSSTEHSELEKRAEDFFLEYTQNNNNNNNNKNANGDAPGNEAAAQTTTPAAAPILLCTTASKFNPKNQKDLMTLTLEKLEKVEKELTEVMYLEKTPENEKRVIALANKQKTLVKVLNNLRLIKEHELSSNDSAGKQPRAISLEAYPSFNPLDWKSEVVTDVANASVKNSTVPCTSFVNFVECFEDVLTRYDRNVQTDWYECLCQVFSISKQTMKSYFDVSAKSPLSWVESLKGLRQDETETLLTFADRFLTALIGAIVTPSEQNKLICLLFFVSLMPRYRELVSEGLKQAYKKVHDRMVVDNDGAEGTYYLPNTFAEMHDFCVTASGEIEAAVKEFKIEESKKHKSGNGKGTKGNSSPSSSQSKTPVKHFPRKRNYCDFFPFTTDHIKDCGGPPPKDSKTNNNNGKPGSKNKRVTKRFSIFF